MLYLLTGCLVPWKEEWSLTTTETDTDTDADTDSDTDADTDTDTDADTDTDTDTETGPPPSTADTGPVELPIEIVDANIVGPVEWTNDRIWVLEEDTLVWVEPNARLTIERGTTVRGRLGSALAIASGGELIARGTADEPIVLTSDREEGSRAPGDWGGLVLLGDAPILPGDGSVTTQFEGIDPLDPFNQFGGTDPDGSCGHLLYVRVEYAGSERVPEEEINGITFGGCGSDTLVQYVQVHRGLDDGIEVFGGTLDFKNILITGPGDDGFDWDFGWTGRMQFAVLQHWPFDARIGVDGASAFEGSVPNPGAVPEFYNVTIAGSADPATTQDGIYLKSGANAVFENLLVGYVVDWAFDLDGEEAFAEATAGRTRVDHALFWEVGGNGTRWVQPGDADGDEQAVLDAGTANQFGVDPLLATPPAPGTDPFVADPAQWVPGLLSPAATGVRPPNNGFYATNATYVGAIPAGATVLWWDGWSRFGER